MPMFANCTGLAGNTYFCNLLCGRASSEQDSEGDGPEVPMTVSKNGPREQWSLIEN